MASSHCPVSRPSSIFKSIFAGFGLMLPVAIGSFSLCYIFFTSMFLIVFTVYFTLISAQNTIQSKPNYEAEDVTDSAIAEQEADKGVFQIQGQEGCGSMHRAFTISENESTGDESDDDQCITESEEDDGNVARSSLSSEDDGSISDEDTLIELQLPTGHYLSPKELQQHKLKQKLPEQRWMELLSELNNELATEEDNFIEIDISIGSIMHPRFEIQA